MADNEFKGAGAGVISFDITGIKCECGEACVPTLLDDGRTEYRCPKDDIVVATVGKRRV